MKRLFAVLPGLALVIAASSAHSDALMHKPAMDAAQTALSAQIADGASTIKIRRSTVDRMGRNVYVGHTTLAANVDSVSTTKECATAIHFKSANNRGGAVMIPWSKVSKISKHNESDTVSSITVHGDIMPLSGMVKGDRVQPSAYFQIESREKRDEIARHMDQLRAQCDKSGPGQLAPREVIRSGVQVVGVDH